jgi:hypothetical protein
VRSKSPAGTRSSNADPDGPASLARLRGHTRASLEHSRFAARCFDVREASGHTPRHIPADPVVTQDRQSVNLLARQ